MVNFDNMQQKSTNKLNNDELSLISSSYYPLLKLSALEKIKNQLHEIGEQFIKEHGGKAFKISAGERLLNLPYLVLDYPKIESQDFNFVCRILFWWGKGIQFQVIYRNITPEQIKNIIDISENDDWVLLGENLWENDLESGDFKIKSEITVNELERLSNRKSLKIVKFNSINVEQSQFFEGVFSFYMRYAVLASQ